MNTQPPEYIGNIFAFIFMGICYCSYVFSKVKPINPDFFELGYIVENSQPIQPIQVAIQQPPIKKVAKVKPTDFTQSQIYQDGVLALRSMGMKKSEAVSKANHIFANKNPSNVQEFILEAFKREHN